MAGSYWSAEKQTVNSTASDDMAVKIRAQYSNWKAWKKSDKTNEKYTKGICCILTRPSCQKKKCTCVNNRCIRSKISDQARPWLSRGWIECEIVTLAGRRVGIKLLYNPGDRKFRSVGEKMQEWGPCPREARPPGPRLSSPGERERNAVMAIRVGVNMLQFCSVSNSPLTQ